LGCRREDKRQFFSIPSQNHSSKERTSVIENCHVDFGVSNSSCMVHSSLFDQRSVDGLLTLALHPLNKGLRIIICQIHHAHHCRPQSHGTCCSFVLLRGAFSATILVLLSFARHHGAMNQLTERILGVMGLWVKLCTATSRIKDEAKL